MSAPAVAARVGGAKEKLGLLGKSERTSGRRGTGAASPAQLVQDHYRCPESFFQVELHGTLSQEAGYFRFGADCIGYGRSTVGATRRQADGRLTDLSSEARGRAGALQLPFDPSEVIENLRRERYAHARGGVEDALRKLYYGLRPLLSPAMRKRVQQFHALGWKHRTFPRWPVDTTVETLSEKLMLLALQARGVEKIPFVWFWPEGARGCIAMTHDVETEAGRDFCGQLMDIDDAAGIKAAFQIVPEDRYPVPAEFLESLRGRGFEIGVQDLNHDGRLFDERQEFLRRAEVINRHARAYGARGFRAGVLYRNPEWYDALDFSYDMSMPNVAHLDPQRGGCCTVFPYFIGDILEIPVTTVQDYTLFQLVHDHSIDLWKKQLEIILAKNGMASFIVHPDYVIEDEPQRVYRELLAHLEELRPRENLWTALPAEINDWWRQRDQMSVVEAGGSLHIEGPGAERAVLAFATQKQGKLVYEVAGGARQA